MTAQSAYSVRRCIRDAVTRSGISSNEIDYINGHLTATIADPLEIGNWSSALERRPGQFPLINSTKSMIGHARDEYIVTAFVILFSQLVELFGAIGEAVDEDDHMFGLASVIVELCDADIAG